MTAADLIRRHYHGKYEEIARAAVEHLHYGRIRKSLIGIAVTAKRSRRTAATGMAYLESIGLFIKTRAGGGPDGRVNIWKINRKHDSIVCKSKPVAHEERIPLGFSLSTENHTPPSFEKDDPPTPPKVEPAVSPPDEKASLQWKSGLALSLSDPLWQRYCDAVRAFLGSIPEPELFRRYCSTVRSIAPRDLTPEAAIAAAHERIWAGWLRYDRFAEGLSAKYRKRGDTFLRDRWFDLQHEGQRCDPKERRDDETFVEMVERRAKAAGCWPARPGEDYDTLWQRVQTAEGSEQREQRHASAVEVRQETGRSLGEVLSDALGNLSHAPEHQPVEYAPRKSLRFDVDGNVIES